MEKKYRGAFSKRVSNTYAEEQKVDESGSSMTDSSYFNIVVYSNDFSSAYFKDYWDEKNLYIDWKEIDLELGWKLDKKIKHANDKIWISIVFQVSNGDIWVAGGRNDWSIKVYDWKYNRIHTLVAHNDEVNMIVQEKHYLFSTADDAKIIWFDIEKEYKVTKVLSHHKNVEVWTISTFPFLKLASGGNKGNLKFWDILSWRCLKFVQYSDKQINNLLYLPKTKNMAVLFRDGQVVFFDVGSRDIKINKVLNFSSVNLRRILKFKSDFIIVISSNGSGTIYNIHNMSPIWKIKWSFSSINDAWMMDEDTLIVWSTRDSVERFQLWKPLRKVIEGKELNLKLRNQVHGFPHSGFWTLKDGRFVSGTCKGSLKIYKKITYFR
jgi:hypothetical protein